MSTLAVTYSLADPRTQANERARTTRSFNLGSRYGPVFLQDCVTPAGGETLLSLLWKRDMARALNDPTE